MKKPVILALALGAALTACSGGGNVMPAGQSQQGQPDNAQRVAPAPAATIPCLEIVRRGETNPCITPHPLPTPSAAPRPTTNPRPTPV